MKHLCLILSSIIIPAFAHATDPGPKACEDVARALVQSHVDAYVWDAEHYPNDFGKYAACKGQPLVLDSETNDGSWMGAPMYGYNFSIQCGADTYRYNYGYILRNGCELRGE